MTNARIDQTLIEGAVAGTPNARLNNALAEAGLVGSPRGLILQTQAEAGLVGSPRALILSVIAEYSVTLPEAPMIPTIAFPDITLDANGGAYSVHRRPTNSTRVAAAVSGREVRTPYYAVPLYEFELTFPNLNSGASPMGALGAETMQALQGFFLQMQGQYGSFLFTDPENCQVTGGTLGTGDGVSTVFPLLRTVGNYSEQVQAANSVTAIYVNGVAQSGTSWAVQNGNEIAFQVPPPAGAVVGGDFSYYFVCRFLDDVHDYEEFMYQLHSLKSCKLRSVRTS